MTSFSFSVSGLKVASKLLSRTAISHMLTRVVVHYGKIKINIIDQEETNKISKIIVLKAMSEIYFKNSHVHKINYIL